MPMTVGFTFMPKARYLGKTKSKWRKHTVVCMLLEKASNNKTASNKKLRDLPSVLPFLSWKDQLRCCTGCVWPYVTSYCEAATSKYSCYQPTCDVDHI